MIPMKHYEVAAVLSVQIAKEWDDPPRRSAALLWKHLCITVTAEGVTLECLSPSMARFDLNKHTGYLLGVLVTRVVSKRAEGKGNAGAD